MQRHIIHLLSLILVSGIVAACATQDAGKALEGRVDVADLRIVDCLLPGQVRQLGTRTYLTARRPVKTTAADCRIRGGEYVAYDRADYKSALKVWMPAAEAGDPEAQTNVGEIFEKGLGTEPNYEAAAIWYRRAAEQGYTRAEFNLGTLYEQGLGVPENKVTALNWYRRAWGLSEDNVVFASAAARERADLRSQLEAALAEKNEQIEALEAQVESLESASDQASSDASEQASTLKSIIAQLEEQRSEERERLAAIPEPKTREPEAREYTPEERALATERILGDINLGRYYALLIGNADYENLDDLDTPLNDIQRAKRILEDKYGFRVFVVANGDNVAVMQAINDLNAILGANDNLLLFYAGHGTTLSTGEKESGYWLPANAEPPPRNTFWVPNAFVTGHLARLDAKRVLVVADSCYAGLLSSEPSFLLVGDDRPQYSNPEFLKLKLAHRSRLLLSSGGNNPVLDGGSGGHSVFADAFLDALEANDGLLASPQLFLRIRDRVEEAAARLDFDQHPQFKTIKAAGHEVGGFFFVPIEQRS